MDGDGRELGRVLVHLDHRAIVRVYRAVAARAESRAELFAADREARAREAVANERARLARELHDSVGHALNVIVLHAGGAQRVLETKPALAQEALGSIETAGRQALGDIERMLGILRATEDEPSYDAQPDLGRLDDLLARVREAGLPVELRVEGTPKELPASLELSAYRIVQEALTNTLKHAGKAHSVVTMTWAPRPARHRGRRRRPRGGRGAVGGRRPRPGRHPRTRPALRRRAARGARARRAGSGCGLRAP